MVFKELKNKNKANLNLHLLKRVYLDSTLFDLMLYIPVKKNSVVSHVMYLEEDKMFCSSTQHSAT